MEVSNAVTQANHRERVSHQAVTIESAQHFAAGMRGHNKHGSRLDLQVGFSPNLALAFLRAISGSIFKNRERFTAEKSKSPTSSCIFRWSCSFTAFFNSSVSSRIFSKTPPISSQSKPMREALRVS